eukprot:TRINITY_DN183_c0_g1_i1.p1 TRINITY_DN183_c0_g1~~TRINITY_DN183_c0_g1_i1.p1  ORF type:complete len:398 (-),score=60.37 TRINITY_DN183_c0_g1_i1:94-1287(-)
MPIPFQVRMKGQSYPPVIMMSVENETFGELVKRVREEFAEMFEVSDGLLQRYDRFGTTAGSLFSLRLPVETLLKPDQLIEFIAGGAAKSSPSLASLPQIHPPSTIQSPTLSFGEVADRPITAIADSDSVDLEGKTNISLLNEYCLRTFHESPIYEVQEAASRNEPFNLTITLPVSDGRRFERRYSGATKRKTARHHLAGEVLEKLNQATSDAPRMSVPVGPTGFNNPSSAVASAVSALTTPVSVLSLSEDENDTQKLNEYCGRRYQGCPTFDYFPEPIPSSSPYTVTCMLPPDGRRISHQVEGVSKKEARRLVSGIALRELLMAEKAAASAPAKQIFSASASPFFHPSAARAQQPQPPSQFTESAYQTPPMLAAARSTGQFSLFGTATYQPKQQQWG